MLTNDVAKFIEDSISNLTGKWPSAVCWYPVKTDEYGRTWVIAIGWGDGFDDELVADEYCDRGWRICSKIGFIGAQTMVLDYSDILMPWGEDGEVDDTDTALPRHDYNGKVLTSLANDLIGDARRVIAEWEDKPMK